MPASTQQHPCRLVLNGHAAARAELRAAVAENRPAKLASQFLGALGEIYAAHELKATHASHIFDEYDLVWNQVSVEVKTTAKSKIGNVNLAGKECKQVCFVRFEQRGEELWLVEIVTRPRGKPKSGPSKTPPKSHPLKPKDGYRVIW